jgi:group I intron endonuclease
MYLIYKLTCLINGKIYVGSTSKTLAKRLYVHKSTSTRPHENNMILYRAMRKHGKDNFIIDQLDSAETREEALTKESLWIKKLQSCCEYGHGYNMRDDSIIMPRKSKLKNMRTRLQLKKEKSNFTSSYLGVSFNSENKRWTFVIDFEGYHRQVKNFATEKDAAVARDIKLLDVFSIKEAVKIMNFPHNIELYLNKTIVAPNRPIRMATRWSRYMYVTYIPNLDNWQGMIIKDGKRHRTPSVKLEIDAAIHADYLCYKLFGGLKPLNFPERIEEYKDPNLVLPKTIVQSKSCPHTYISIELSKSKRNPGRPSYRVCVQHRAPSSSKTFRSLETAIIWRNEQLIKLQKPIPD